MSFGAATAVREAGEMPTDGVGLRAALRAHDQHAARLTMAVSVFVRFGDWDIAGYASPVQWLKDQAGMTGDDAYRMVQQAKKLHALPVTAQAWLAGELSGGQVRIICTQVVDRHVDLFAQHEAAVVPELVGLSVDDTLAAMRVWRARADALNEGPAPDDRPTAHLSPTLDDRGLLTANLDAEAYAVMKEALRIADSEDLDVSPALRRGEALTTVARFFLDHHDKKLRNRNRPRVNVVINAETLGTDVLTGYFASTGMPARSETLERYLCDCDVHRMMHKGGEVLDLGRAARLVSPAIYQALLLRDGGCRFKGCDRPAEWCEVHHTVPWKDGGTTSVFTMVLGCSKHHHVLHQPGWHSELAPDGTLTVTPPDGKTWTTKPRIVTQQLDPRLFGEKPRRGSPFEEHLELGLLRARSRAPGDADFVISFDRAA